MDRLFEAPLAADVTAAVHQVRRLREPVVLAGLSTREGSRYTLQLKPFSTQSAYENWTLLTFLDSSSLLLEEVEGRNGEFPLTYEELSSLNVKLLGANRSLQTDNRELAVINSEYEYTMEMLRGRQRDMEHVLASTGIGLILLDPKLRIRWFTPAVMAEFPLSEEDKGRAIRDIAPRFAYKDLADDAERVLQTLKPLTLEVAGGSGRCYCMRILPYRTGKRLSQGLVLTFTDITELNPEG